MARLWMHPGGMRYPDGGGLTARQRGQREQVRFETTEMFAHGLAPPQVARRLRVPRKSAYAWHARWRDGGRAALCSGPVLQLLQPVPDGGGEFVEARGGQVAQGLVRITVARGEQLGGRQAYPLGIAHPPPCGYPMQLA